MRAKYERIIDEFKKNSTNDREFIQKELQRRIEELEKQMKEAKEQYEKDKEAIDKKREDMRAEYERQLIE